MGSFWEEANRCDTFGVATPGVDELLGKEAVMIRGVSREINVKVLRRGHVRPPQIVVLDFSVKDRLFSARAVSVWRFFSCFLFLSLRLSLKIKSKMKEKKRKRKGINDAPIFRAQ